MVLALRVHHLQVTILCNENQRIGLLEQGKIENLEKAIPEFAHLNIIVKSSNNGNRLSAIER